MEDDLYREVDEKLLTGRRESCFSILVNNDYLALVLVLLVDDPELDPEFVVQNIVDLLLKGFNEGLLEQRRKVFFEYLFEDLVYGKLRAQLLFPVHVH